MEVHTFRSGKTELVFGMDEQGSVEVTKSLDIMDSVNTSFFLLADAFQDNVRGGPFREKP
jgi:hypothetical protein